MTTSRLDNAPYAGGAVRRSHWRTLLAGIGMVLAATSSIPAHAEEYTLGVQDMVKVKVFEWRASRDAIFEWQALNDTFVVGPGGILSLPLAGDFQVAGHTTKELATAISDSLMRNMDLGRRPNATVQVVQFRPYYIVGAVTQSGEFAFRPGLTVLQAVSIAGGFKSRTESVDRAEREAIASQGELDLIDLSKTNLQARRARLEAELAGALEIRFPNELTSRASEQTVLLLLDQERQIFKARAEGLDSQVRSLTTLKEYLVKELGSLNMQLTILDRQLALLQKELAAVTTLVTKGFAEAPRQLGLERALAQLQGDRVTAETALLRANQEISKTDIAIVNTREDRRKEVTSALRDTQAELDGLGSKTETTRQLLNQSQSTIDGIMPSDNDTESVQPVFKILRPQADQMIELGADERTFVQPGDTIKVEVPRQPQSAVKTANSGTDHWRTASADGERPAEGVPEAAAPTLPTTEN